MLVFLGVFVPRGVKLYVYAHVYINVSCLPNLDSAYALGVNEGSIPVQKKHIIRNFGTSHFYVCLYVGIFTLNFL